MINKINPSKISVFLLLFVIVLLAINVNVASAAQFQIYSMQNGAFFVRIAEDTGHAVSACKAFNYKPHINFEVKSKSTDRSYIMNLHLAFTSKAILIYESQTGICTSVKSPKEIIKIVGNVGRKVGSPLLEINMGRFFTPLIMINPQILPKPIQNFLCRTANTNAVCENSFGLSGSVQSF